MLIYTNNITPRFSYIIETLLGKNVVVTQDVAQYSNATEACKLNYSNHRILSTEIWIVPHGLLQQTNIAPQAIDCFVWQKLPVFFPSKGSIPFDLLAAAFFLISRYEEYLPHQTDMYGRFPHTASLAYQQSFLHLPLVQLWLQQLHQCYPAFAWPNTQFCFTPTYDIDIAYQYLHHSMVHTIGGFFKDFLAGNIDKVIERSTVLTGNRPDPFDNYDWLHQLHQQYHLQPVYFFLVAQQRKGYDKNLSPKSKGVQHLIQQHALRYTIGLHPSYQSHLQANVLMQEKNCLQQMAKQPIVHSRQHYIKMQLPHTYQCLLQQGITHDYSMGYGSINGFRASYSLPFYWFDLQQNQCTHLCIYPFCYMEANSFFEQKYTATQAAAELEDYHNIVQQVQGHFITIFHNHFITNQPQWQAWRAMYHNYLNTHYTHSH